MTFVIQLQEFETQKWDPDAADADAGRTDRREGWNSYVDDLIFSFTKNSIIFSLLYAQKNKKYPMLLATLKLSKMSAYPIVIYGKSITGEGE